MQDINNIQNQDIFGESIKNKLENYPMPLDESVWKGIEKQLAPKKKRIVPIWWYVAGGGVAASLALLLLLTPIKNDNTNRMADNKSVQIETTKSQTTLSSENQNIPSSSGNQEYKKEKSLSNVQSKSQQYKTIKQTSTNSSNTSLETETKNQNTKNSDIISTSNNQSSTAFQANEVKQGIANSDLQNRDSIPAKKTNPEITSLPEIPEVLEDVKEKPSNKKIKNNWLLAVNVGTYGKSDLSSSKGDLYANAAPLTVKEMYGDNLNALTSSANAYIIQPNQFTSIQHFPPLAFQFLVQKNFTPHLGVSTGLVYTYLRSNYSYSYDWQEADATLDLHYLGIPLNLNVLISEKKHWNYYFSTGGTVEKGMRSIYKQTIKNQNAEQNTNVYSKIDGVQTSINAAFGVGYKLDKNWSLFFEPKITYYFKNNQPMSARTETPLNVGFNGGLRIGL
ncbi:conserved hypothetical protein [uncultured Paludibacter sp.]|nr:conserved hypothetical protein [uncultured Paludibacter sp.]